MQFCILGSGRCGSTIVMRMLNEHPHVHVINETQWLPKLYEFFGDARANPREMLEIVRRSRHVNGKPTTLVADDVRAEFEQARSSMNVREFVDRIGLGLAHASGKVRWADKTPDYFAHMAMIHSLWPACRFVHLIRNGAEVAVSMAGHPGYQALAAAGEISWCSLTHGFDAQARSYPPTPVDHSAYLQLWRMRVLRARAESKRLPEGTYREWRFEDLRAEPRQVLDEIAAFVGCDDASVDWREVAVSKVDRARKSSRKGVFRGTPDAESDALMRTLGYWERA